MTSRTKVPRWTPPLGDSVRLAWRPALAYLVFAGLGSLALLFTAAVYGKGGDFVLLTLGTVAGLLGVVLGQFISILRVRALPVFIAGGLCLMFGGWVAAYTGIPGNEYLGVSLLCFCFAFPCGLLSLMHRWELFASFWPAVGWIGGVFVILNHEGRVQQWEKDKVSAWLPIPLLFLAGFLILWLFYLAAKQAARVELWQALSGGAARRVSKAETKHRAGAIPRRNVIPLLIAAALLFAGTAVLAPYLWRTGKGDREGHHSTTENQPKPPRSRPTFNGEALMEQLQKLAKAAEQTLPKLWPLLLLLLLYRPTKRALLLTHLKAPIVPTPPSERIDNLWEYVRIAAEDAGVVPTSADSVEQLMTRIRETKRASPQLEKAAEIYVRTRYGFTVQPGDAIAMRGLATDAAKVLRRDLDAWTTVKNLWRPLT